MARLLGLVAWEELGASTELGRRRLAREGVSAFLCKRVTVDGVGPCRGGLGWREITRLVKRTMPQTSPSAVDRALKALGLLGIRRAIGARTTVSGKDGNRTGDLLNRDFTAPAPNRTWVVDFTHVRTWAGFAYVAFVVDIFAQRIIA